MQSPMSRENMIRGVLFFVLFTIIGLVLSFVWSSGIQDIKGGAEDLKQVFLDMRYEFLIGAFVCMLLDWLCAGLRFHVFIKVVTPAMKFRNSFRAILATICVSAITPFQTGGVGHLYIYARSGAKLSAAITGGIAAFLSTLVILIVSAGGILWINPNIMPKGSGWISLFSLLIFSLVFTTFLLLLFKPEIVFRIFSWISDQVSRRFKPLAPFLQRVQLKADQITTEHKAFAQTLIREHKWICFLSLLLTCGFFAARIVGGYYVIRAFNENASLRDLTFVEILWDLTVVEMLYNFVILFMPTPGASGFAELTKNGLMEKIIAKKYIPPFVLLNRFFAVYSGVIAGGIVIALQIGKDLKKTKKDLAEDTIQQVSVQPVKRT